MYDKWNKLLIQYLIVNSDLNCNQIFHGQTVLQNCYCLRRSMLNLWDHESYTMISHMKAAQEFCYSIHCDQSLKAVRTCLHILVMIRSVLLCGLVYL